MGKDDQEGIGIKKPADLIRVSDGDATKLPTQQTVTPGVTPNFSHYSERLNPATTM